MAAIDSAAVRRATACAGGRIVWRIWGEGRPLVLIHGDFGSWTHWIRNVLALGRDCRVVAADMPGYGDSDSPREPWSLESLARSLAQGLSALLPRSQRYSLAGFSFGGIVAAHLAALEGERVDNLALFGPGGFGLPPAKTPALRRVAADMDARETIAVNRHNLGALMIADPAKLDDLAVLVQIENIRRARSRAGSIPHSDALLRALPEVRARVHTVWGERDAMAAAELRQREVLLRHFHQDLEFRLIGGAGHWTPYEAPGRVNAILAQMLSGERR